MKLGEKAREKITGFSGVITGKTEYLTGCNMVLLQPPIDKEGKFVQAHWFDEDRIEVIPEKPVEHTVSRPGPCDPAPIR